MSHPDVTSYDNVNRRQNQSKCDKNHMSHCMKFPTMWYVRPGKPQISLRLHTV